MAEVVHMRWRVQQLQQLSVFWAKVSCLRDHCPLQKIEIQHFFSRGLFAEKMKLDFFINVWFASYAIESSFEVQVTKFGIWTLSCGNPTSSNLTDIFQLWIKPANKKNNVSFWLFIVVFCKRESSIHSQIRTWVRCVLRASWIARVWNLQSSLKFNTSFFLCIFLLYMYNLDEEC